MVLLPSEGEEPNMNFVAIDFETANEKRSSPCALGIAVVEDGRIAESRSWLIRPPELRFNPINTRVHGIHERDVVDKPTFDRLWPEIAPHLAGTLLVAHNAVFDMSVLCRTLHFYGIQQPRFSQLCTRGVARTVWPGLFNYRLDTVARALDIDFAHHDAEEDAVTCAKVLLRGQEQDQGVRATVATLRRTLDGPPTRERAEAGRGPIAGLTFVFTGTLMTMNRKAATTLVTRLGGLAGNTVTAKTNFLVLGMQDYSSFVDGKRSAKHKKAEAVLAAGGDIEIISEEDFWQMLDEGCV